MARGDFLRVIDGAPGAGSPATRRVMIEFHPEYPPEELALFSDASAAHLVPVLRAALAKLEAGELRMPVDGGLRWVDDSGQEKAGPGSTDFPDHRPLTTDR